LGRRLVGLQSRSERFGEEINLFPVPLSEMEPWPIAILAPTHTKTYKIKKYMLLGKELSFIFKTGKTAAFGETQNTKG
jgi:hypothetical protein